MIKATLKEACVSSALSAAESLARLRLARSGNVGPKAFRTLLRLYGSAEAATGHVETLGFGSRGVTLLPLAAAEKEMEGLAALGGTLLTLGGEGYPPLLAAVPDAPAVLSVLGDPSYLTIKETVALVGARHASAGGIRMAFGLAAELAREKVMVVSGLARGIDTAAHKGALSLLPEYGGTVAVLAGGVDHVYPPENEKLYREIIQHGAIVSEMPLGAAPLAQHFPRRNRIISGLSQASVVVEASVKSGSLITARFALEQGREVGAVPGFPLEARAEGPNKLLKQGAFLVESVEDILSSIRSYALPPPPEATLFEEGAEPFEGGMLADVRQQLERLLSAHPVPIDQLVRQAQAPASLVQVALLEMELAGLALRHPGGLISGRLSSCP